MAAELVVETGLWVRLATDLVITFMTRGGFVRAGAAGARAARAGAAEAGAADDGAAELVADAAEFDVLGEPDGSEGRAAFVVVIVELF